MGAGLKHRSYWWALPEDKSWQGAQDKGTAECRVLTPGTAVSGSQRLHVLSAIAVTVVKAGSASKPSLPATTAGLIGRILASAKYTWECIPDHSKHLKAPLAWH